MPAETIVTPELLQALTGDYQTVLYSVLLEAPTSGCEPLMELDRVTDLPEQEQKQEIHRILGALETRSSKTNSDSTTHYL